MKRDIKLILRAGSLKKLYIQFINEISENFQFSKVSAKFAIALSSILYS